EGERETVLPLTPLSRAPFARTRAVRRPATPQAIARPQTIPPALRLPNARDIAGLGRTLSDCTPEKLSSLPADERARCPMTLGGPAGKGAAPYKRPASQSRYRALWAATLAQRETPVRVPCATVKTLYSAPGMPDLQRSQAIIVDPICATQELLKALER
ncbi:MAG: hypothetical protein KJS68_11435, partial [Alphaproteobacteria bacterium]|nr:hypothetical protein [Alphaproteobacteria bacterium]